MSDASNSQTDAVGVLDLTDYHTRGVRVISGRDRGELVRGEAEVENLDQQLGSGPGGFVRVIVPSDVVFVSSSFYLGLFGPTVRRFGADAFRERYRFEGPYSEENLKDSIQEAIQRGTQEAVKRGSPLPSLA